MIKKIIFIILLSLLFSCGNKKVIQLPEIENATITNIFDTSTIYMFFNEETNTIEFNRKNMISTTNWLVNIDKRLTLNQVLPHLQYLQEKRYGDGLHKSKKAKNYFTCHDTKINNLGFLEFTDVVYNSQSSPTKFSTLWDKNKIDIYFKSINDISILGIDEKGELVYSSFPNFKENLSLYQDYLIQLNFEKNIYFQDYITIKSNLLKIDIENLTISNNEFIY